MLTPAPAGPAGVDGTVTADYSQIEVHLPDGCLDLRADDGLLLVVEDDHAVLTVARQHGTVPVRIEIHESDPPHDPAWDAVTEVSAHSGGTVRVTGWAGEGVVAAALPAGSGVRIRYAVRDGQVGSEQFRQGRWDEAPAEWYVLQVWPAPVAHPGPVIAQAPWSQYWAFGPAAVEAVRRLDGVADPGRLVALIDAALFAHPDVAARVRAGDGRFRVGVIRYAQELFRVTHGSDVYADVRADHVALARLIDERAAARG